MRRARLIRFLASLDYGKAPLMAVAAALVAVSALFSLRFAESVGAPSGNAQIFMLMALAFEGYAAFALPVLWPRLAAIGRLVLLLFLALCLAYKITAADRFAAENFGKRESERERLAERYKEAEARVTLLRKRLAETADARPAALIEAEIAALLRDPRAENCEGVFNGEVTRRVCPKVDRLRAELARAQSFARTEEELAAAIAAYSQADPVRAPSEAARSFVPWLLGLIGFPPIDFTALISKLTMLMVEAGSVAVPAMVGLARRREETGEPAPARRPPAPISLGPEEAPPQISPRPLSESQHRLAAELIGFLGERTERAAGEKVQASALFAAYTAWAISRRREPMSIHQFGTALTQHLGLAKAKSGGLNWYLNVRLKAPAARGASARHLQAVGA
jgi:hypothetical protein